MKRRIQQFVLALLLVTALQEGSIAQMDISAVMSPAANSWTSGAPMPTARQGTATGVIKGKVYVVGGATGNAITGITEVYNPTSNSWTTGAPMPTPRFVPASAVVNNILYVIGGQSGSGVLDVVEAYNPATNQWSAKAAMPTARDSVGAVVKQGMIYVIGGFSPGGGRLSTVERYNPATNSWTELAPLKVGKSLPAVGLIGSTIVVAGGFTNSNAPTTDNEGYNTVTNVWSPSHRFHRKTGWMCVGHRRSVVFCQRVEWKTSQGRSGLQFKNQNVDDAHPDSACRSKFWSGRCCQSSLLFWRIQRRPIVSRNCLQQRTDLSTLAMSKGK